MRSRRAWRRRVIEYMVTRDSEEAARLRLDIRQWRRRFPIAIKAVKAGQDVTVTEHGEPIAVIFPIQAARDEAALRRMEAAGLLVRATKRWPMPPFKPIKIKGRPISETLREDRDAR